MLGDSAGIDVARDGKGYSMRGQVRYADGIVSDTVAGNELQTFRNRDQFGVDRRHAHDDSLGFGCGLEPFRRIVREAADPEPTVLPQPGFTRFGNLAENHQIDVLAVACHDHPFLPCRYDLNQPARECRTGLKFDIRRAAPRPAKSRCPG